MSNVLYVSRTAEYFAQVIDIPWIVKQERLEELQEYMGAGESVDFNLSTYQDANREETVRVGRLFHLPFRLSLGLHESVEPVINAEATRAIFEAYKSTMPLHPKEKDKLLIKMQRSERAQSAIGGALVEASIDRTYADQLGERLKFARRERMLDYPNGSTIRHAMKLLSQS